MLVELIRGAARTTLQVVEGELYVNGEIVENKDMSAAVLNSVQDCSELHKAMLHRLYLDYKLQGWKEVQVYF